ncbi:serine aminopeptidase domain-containing protein [Cognatitamlana onchidii]|uniref:serine aminopeptidase domain-containing protein n=1 Tax=Cognatitamlana onchidii TaxID=2562860 RepID=UPI0010A67EE3|nr:alpha/beta hydrolase [Algibacter onchidii]
MKQNIFNPLIISTLLSITFSISSNSQELKRRGLWESKIAYPKNNIPGAKIVSVTNNSAFETAGLKADDMIIEVNDILIDTPETWTEIKYDVRAQNNTKFKIIRGNDLLIKHVNFKEYPKEKHPNLETYYEQVTNRFGITQRVIITKPKNIKTPQPAIVLIGGLSCSSIEAHPTKANNWTRLIKDLVEKSEMVVMRIEKPGVGDSEGDCSKSDFLTDLSGYKAAITHLKSKTYINTSKIVVYGSSMGSALAPLLANEYDLAGVISDGTFFKTWFEHMLEIERRILSMKGNNESTIVKKMNTYYIPLYYGMLIQKKSYMDIVNDYPALSEYNYHGPYHMYGRPLKYYQQLQDFDIAGAWEKVNAPVRILRGTNDWIMSAFDNQMILKVLQQKKHSNFELYEYPGLDHWNTIHESALDSFKGKPGKWDDKISQTIINWAKEIVVNDL